MAKYILKRLLMMLPVILGISFLLFSIMNLTPGDPARLRLGEFATQEDVEKLREEMGLNENFFIRYINYLKDAVRGDFGNSYNTNLPVMKDILARFPVTLRLSFNGICLAVLIGIPVGIISAVKQYTIVDTTSLILALLLAAMPVFWLGLILILVFSLKLDLLPSNGIDTWIHYILPSLTLSATSIATLIRMTRSTMLEVIRQDYIRTAKAKGANERRIVFKHALRNALLPVVTVIGINFGVLLGGAVVVESVFGIPGLGTLMINAVKMKDTPTVMASIMFAAMLAGVVNLAVDILYTYIDPRVKTQYL